MSETLKIKALDRFMHSPTMYEAGQTYELPAAQARDLEKAGLVKVLGQAKGSDDSAQTSAPAAGAEQKAAKSPENKQAPEHQDKAAPAHGDKASPSVAVKKAER